MKNLPYTHFHTGKLLILLYIHILGKNAILIYIIVISLPSSVNNTLEGSDMHRSTSEPEVTQYIHHIVLQMIDHSTQIL